MTASSTSNGSGHEAGEARRLLGLAWPVVLTSLNWTLLQVTDLVVVGLTGTAQAAALGASRSLTFVVIVAGLAWLSGVLVDTARADGAGDEAGTGAALRGGLVLAVVLGMAATLLLALAAAPLLRIIGVDAALVAPGARVVGVMAFAYPFQFASIAGSYFLEGLSRPRRVALVNLAVLPLNALLAWAWSGGHGGLAAQGAVGAAAATLVASMVNAAGIALSIALLRARSGIRTRIATVWRGAGAEALALARFGAVPALAAALELAGFAVLIGLSTRLGAVADHAFQIVFAVHNVTYGLALGVGSAAGVRAGNAVGEGQPEAAIARTRIAVTMAVAALGVAALLLAARGAALARLFPASPPVHALAAAMLPAWAPFIAFDGAQVVLVYALRSLGDQVVAGVNSILAYFVVTGGVGLVLVARGGGPMALVWASGSGMVAAALLHGARFALVSARLRRRS